MVERTIIGQVTGRGMRLYVCNADDVTCWMGSFFAQYFVTLMGTTNRDDESYASNKWKGSYQASLNSWMQNLCDANVGVEVRSVQEMRKSDSKGWPKSGSAKSLDTNLIR